jgi:hypothetical protein
MVLLVWAVFGGLSTKISSGQEKGTGAHQIAG